MISHLKGTLTKKETNYIIIDVNGVGYYVATPTSLYERLPQEGEQTEIKTHLVVKEDALSLYGFLTSEEEHLFSTLITVSGVGPKAALSFLSTYPIDKLVAAITQGNTDLLVSVSGIGKKTAQRIIIELKEKIAKAYGTDLKESFTAAGEKVDQNFFKDAVSALVTLGYAPKEARSAILKTLSEIKDPKNIEEIIKKSLLKLS